MPCPGGPTSFPPDFRQGTRVVVGSSATANAGQADVKQLTGLDATFLNIETPSSFGHISSVVIYERPDDPTFEPFEAFHAQLEKRLHLLEPLRRKLVEVPFGLDHPYWINDPDFDLDFHIRHLSLPRPGTMEQLSTQVARIVGRPCDRGRPLWEVYVIEGLENDEFAILTKVHHATIDGASGVEMLMLMLDSDPAGDQLPIDDETWVPESVPSNSDLLGRAVVNYVRTPGRVARLGMRAIREVASTSSSRGATEAIDQLRSRLPSKLGGHTTVEREQHRPHVLAPPTPFNRSIGPNRRLAMGSAPLADVKQIKSALGVTVNDVVMAVSAGALRSYLISHDALPEDPLRAMVPVSIRTGQEADRWTNRVAAVFVSIPTHLDDPLERVQAAHEAMNRAKDQFELMPADTLVEMADLAMPAIVGQASRLAGSLHLADRASSAPVNVVISNVPGPRQPLYMAGARMRRFFPVSTITEGVGLNITVQSYLDSLDFGLIACRDLMPDLDDLLDQHIAEIDVLLDAAGVERA